MPKKTKTVKKTPVDQFYEKLFLSLDGKRPQWTPQEKDWLKVFRRVADKWNLQRDISYDVSMLALIRCHAKGRSDRLSYVRTACENAHKDYARQQRKWRRQAMREKQAFSFDAVDTRLDLDDALARMDERQANVLRWRKMGHTEVEIGEKLGITERQVRRVLREAEEQARLRLGPAYEMAA